MNNCNHERIEPLPLAADGSRMGRCAGCGDDTFPIRLSPTEEQWMAEVARESRDHRTPGQRLADSIELRHIWQVARPFRVGRGMAAAGWGARYRRLRRDLGLTLGDAARGLGLT